MTIVSHIIFALFAVGFGTRNLITKKGDEKNRAFAVAKGIKVNEIKKAEKAIKCKITLSIVKKG